jgi:penicillin-binding protein 1B
MPAKVRKSTKKKREPAPSVLRRLTTISLSVVVGAFVGAGLVVAALYHQATSDVDRLLAGPVWSENGRVLSGPMEIWPGLSLTPEALASDLQGAGYARVSALHAPNDFTVSDSAVVVRTEAAKNPDVRVTFEKERVKSVSPGKRTKLRATELARVGGPDGESRHPVKLKEVPKSLVDAVLAVEDARFYEHEGIDPLGVLRAIVVNAVAGETKQGGSTLTQQLVKNLFLTQERSLSRKGKEAILALALEQRVSKDRILELYLNEIYLGQHGSRAICGMDEAARTWFGKPVGRLELEESATLAGMVAGPNLYSPVRHPDRAKERRDVVIDRMVEVGFLSRTAGNAAKAKPLVVHASEARRKAPWAVDLAFEKAEQQLGAGSVSGRGLEIGTTISPALQRLAEKSVATSLEELAKKHPYLAAAEGKPGVEMALVAVRPSDGAVLALVGGHDYAETPFDRVTHGRRQVGSTVKLLTALVAFDSDPDLSGASRFDDSPIELVVEGEVWAPTNYDGEFLGPVSLRRAIADSRNVPAVLLAQHVGMDRLARGWKALGLSGATARPSSALGAFEATPLQLASAFTAFPGNGVVARPRIVTAVVDGSGATVWSDAPETTRVASAQAAFLATDLGVEVLRSGTGASASRYGVRGGAGGKTGTTNDNTDAWFAGFTHDLVVVVWVGFDQGRKVGLTGGVAALPAWARFVSGSGTAHGTFDPPSGLDEVKVCAETGGRATDRCPETTTEWFQSGHEPDQVCELHGTIVNDAAEAARDAWSGLRGLFRRRSDEKADPTSP